MIRLPEFESFWCFSSTLDLDLRDWILLGLIKKENTNIFLSLFPFQFHFSFISLLFDRQCVRQRRVCISLSRDTYGTARNFGKPISIPLSFLQGETKARVRAARDYGNRADRPVNTCENLEPRRLSPQHRSLFLRLAFFLAEKIGSLHSFLRWVTFDLQEERMLSKCFRIRGKILGEKLIYQEILIKHENVCQNLNFFLPCVVCTKTRIDFFIK